MILILSLDWKSDSQYFLMTTLEGVSYSSLSRLEQEGVKVQRPVANDKITSSAIKDYFIEHPFEGSIDAGFESCDNSFDYGQNTYPPEVNLKNVLGGMLAILTGRNKPLGGTENTKSPSSHLAFIGSEESGDILLQSSFCKPAPRPLLEPNGKDYIAYKDLLEVEPPEWLPDSSARFCMQCTATFTALTRGRHHCRFCGGVFCRSCTKGRCLLPVKFRERNPQRVCDVCYDRLDPLQSVLIDSISNAVQGAKHDVIDWTCGRRWFNLPIGLSMEYEIYKASNTLRSYSQVAKSSPERSIPLAVLREAKGLAILTVAKAGLMLTYKLGTGLVIAQRSDKTWSAPSAIASAGLGWGAQIGGEITDFIIVLHDMKAVKTFCSRMHISLGAGCSAAAGPVGRVLEADIRASDRGSGMCYTYSRSKGAFVGMSLEGNFVATRMDMNSQFYGDPYLTTSDILLGTVNRPKAAEPLYAAVDDLYASL